MRSLASAELLELWERGQSLAPVDRPLVFLDAALTDETTVGSLADASLGRRDAWLLDLRAREFGRTLRGLTTCTSCGAEIETEFDVDAVRAPFAGENERRTVEVDGAPVTVRAPTSWDLDAVSGSTDARAAVALLVERCIVSGASSDTDFAAIDGALAALDPQADVVLDIACPGCGGSAAVALDIAEFFWIELCAWAEQALADVDALARAYGWSEHEVLALSPSRRQRYVEMLGA